VDIFATLGLEHPVVQAGMGGGAAGAELAGAVSAAGGLGTVGTTGPRSFAAALRAARSRAPGRPVAANLLVPFLRHAHIGACIEERVALVVFHGGLPRRALAELRSAGIPAFCTVGGQAQARAAVRAGAAGLVAQGVEAGGHLAADLPIADVLPAVVSVAEGRPVFAAGGVADAGDVRRVLGMGATAAVAGTRFLLTEECRAHPDYQQRVLSAQRTVRTLLFGLGWPLAHRVVPNAATERWCRDGDPPWVQALSRLSAPLRRAPIDTSTRLSAMQRASLPMFTPALPLRWMPADSVDRCALYAGESALRIDDVLPAGEALARLVP
jgi:NAD(P)H-dependent flavin oxidoreductase YrpB (nitropropane dioxygenase family)